MNGQLGTLISFEEGDGPARWHVLRRDRPDRLDGRGEQQMAGDIWIVPFPFSWNFGTQIKVGYTDQTP